MASFLGKRRKAAVTTLYCAVDFPELEAIRRQQWRAFPPCGAGTAAFYPALNVHFARQKARHWPPTDGGPSYVMCFRISAAYVRSFEVQTLSGEVHEELWVPAEELENFNRNIVGKIRMVQALLPE